MLTKVESCCSCRCLISPVIAYSLVSPLTAFSFLESRVVRCKCGVCVAPVTEKENEPAGARLTCVCLNPWQKGDQPPRLPSSEFCIAVTVFPRKSNTLAKSPTTSSRLFTEGLSHSVFCCRLSYSSGATPGGREISLCASTLTPKAESRAVQKSTGCQLGSSEKAA